MKVFDLKQKSVKKSTIPNSTLSITIKSKINKILELHEPSKLEPHKNISIG